jgi:hypothetical protein
MRMVVMGLALLLASPALAEGPITAWCGGGVTGGGGGTRIMPDGTVIRLSRRTATATQTITPLGQDPAAYVRWNEALARAGFAAMKRGEFSNMTCSLSQDRTTVLWPINAPPPALEGVFREMQGWRP